MAEIVKLKAARKAKARAEKEATAAANRAAYGLSKAQKARDKATQDKAARLLDGHRTNRPDKG